MQPCSKSLSVATSSITKADLLNSLDLNLHVRDKLGLDCDLT